MVKEILKAAETKMQGVIESTKHDFAAVRTGRANPAILHKVTVDAYGTTLPLDQTANVSAPEARLIVITPWDKKLLKEIEKAILKSDVGLTPTNDGSVIRLVIPPLTEERRKDLVKGLKKQAEEERIRIRNIRRDANETLKAEEKKGEITEDESRKAQEDTQKLTDKYIAEIDHLLETKEKEIMEV